ncbi:hypothetical protein OH686_11825 [Pseudomonas sp. SO81]|nr:hypothetical protein OH686_11825 [Pseudomonas sp. SO81]
MPQARQRRGAAELEIDLGNQSRRLQCIGEQQTARLHADGSHTLIDAATGHADVGEAALIAGGIDGARLNHHQGIARHFFR